MNDNNSLFGGMVYRYTREQAIQDGQLVDVTNSAEAREAGFTIPVAMTRSVWDRYVEVPEGVACQDLGGRLWDVLYMLSIAIQRTARGSDMVFIELHVRNDNREGMPPLVSLKAICGPGDEGEPVLTIMMPDED